MTYLGPLMRIAAISTPPPTEYPPIPWITITLKCSVLQPEIWYQFQTVFMSTYNAIWGLPVHVRDTHHNYDVAPFSHDYLFDSIEAKKWSALLDAATSDPLDYDQAYPFASGYFSADIPSVVEIVNAGNIGNGQFRLSGTDVILETQPPFSVPVGSVWATGASILNPPNTDPFPGAITNFTVNYDNPNPYDGGIFPPGTGSAEYYLVRLFNAGGFRWAEFKKVPD
jgi:hypothetical protein